MRLLVTKGPEFAWDGVGDGVGVMQIDVSELGRCSGLTNPKVDASLAKLVALGYLEPVQ
jgi:hypothetical protein